MNAVENFPRTKSSSERILCCREMLVWIPSMTNESSARRILRIASLPGFSSCDQLRDHGIIMR